MRGKTLCLSFLLIAASMPLKAGGLIGDAINVVAPGAGTALDNAHRQFKNAVPPYKAIEEGGSKLVNEAIVQQVAPLLQEAIARSRDDALGAGVQPIPSAIRENLTGFIPDNILNLVRYRVGGGGDLSLQVNSIRYGDALAITLDYVVVFARENDALYNPVLWAHELKHVIQYQSWGMRDFAIRYVRDYGSVEREAYDNQARYVAWVSTRNASQGTSINRPVISFGVGNSNMCGTQLGSCQVSGSAPVGTPCWCNTPSGAAAGALWPLQKVNSPTPAPPGFPSGTVMQQCGCWGQGPVFASEPRCASGTVRGQYCPAMCGPGNQAYGYICN